MTYKVFISYAHEDKTDFKEIIPKLRDHGIFESDDYIIIDPQESISPGEDLRESIKNKIKLANKVVIFNTNKSESSQWVNYEAGMADALGKPIVVVGHPGVGKSSFVSHLSKYRAVEFKINDIDTLLKQLSNEISKMELSIEERRNAERALENLKDEVKKEKPHNRCDKHIKELKKITKTAGELAIIPDIISKIIAVLK